MTLTHLEERSHYEERYDEATITQCRRIEDLFLSPEIQEKFLPEGSSFPDRIMPLQLLQLTGERYLGREKRINEWMERDRRRDLMLAQAHPPLIRCSSCGQLMECLHTSLHYGFEENESDKLEFFLGCKPCKQSRHVYENGREIIREPILCEKCNKETESDRVERDGKHYYIRTCKYCGYTEETLSILDEEKKAPTQEEIDQFNRDKQRFCISEEQGKRYVELMKRMQDLEKQKEDHLLNMDLYDKLKETKKLTIAALEQLLVEFLNKAGFADLRISMSPGHGVVLDFAVRDLKADRAENESKKALENVIESVIGETNWSLAEYLSYRLGFLNGQLKGYESEPDLEKLVRSRMKKKPIKKQREIIL